jgi:hypothetical protein
VSDISRAATPAAAPGRGASPAPDRVPDEAFVAVRPLRPAVVVRLKRAMPLRHGLMLVLAAALMVMGGVRAHRQPMHRAIVVPAPALQGSVIT